MSTGSSGDIEKGHQVHTETVAYKGPSQENPVSSIPRPSRIANACPAGIFSFAGTAFILSLFNLNTRGIHTPNVVVGMAIFVGGLVQFMAGMWEFPRGNVFGATVFSSFGAFWMSYASIFIPASGILSAYSDPKELGNAIGIYLITWCMLSILFIFPVMRRNLTFTLLLVILAVTFLLLALSQFTGMTSLTKAGGIVGIITALVAYYIGVSEMMAAESTAMFKLPLGVWPK